MFFRDRFPDLAKVSLPSAPAAVSTIDGRLKDVFRDAMVFCHFLRDPTRQALDILIFEEAVVSLCYRLLSYRNLHNARYAINHESYVHLGLLLFSMTTFLQYRGRQIIEFPALARCIYDVLREADRKCEPQVLLWLSMLAGMWIADERARLASIVRYAAASLGLISWNVALRILHKFPWLPALHEGPGRTLWDKVYRSNIPGSPIHSFTHQKSDYEHRCTGEKYMCNEWCAPS